MSPEGVCQVARILFIANPYGRCRFGSRLVHSDDPPVLLGGSSDGANVDSCHGEINTDQRKGEQLAPLLSAQMASCRQKK
ncbi:MAG TPA: hypothetical protein VHV83_12385 [Armatimonadota bacterium]|nr:hypothetical protein [Armatimonadota bacterium]